MGFQRFIGADVVRDSRQDIILATRQGIILPQHRVCCRQCFFNSRQSRFRGNGRFAHLRRISDQHFTITCRHKARRGQTVRNVLFSGHNRQTGSGLLQRRWRIEAHRLSSGSLSRSRSNRNAARNIRRLVWCQTHHGRNRRRDFCRQLRFDQLLNNRDAALGVKLCGHTFRCNLEIRKTVAIAINRRGAKGLHVGQGQRINPPNQKPVFCFNRKAIAQIQRQHLVDHAEIINPIIGQRLRHRLTAGGLHRDGCWLYQVDKLDNHGFRQRQIHRDITQLGRSRIGRRCLCGQQQKAVWPIGFNPA